MVRGVFVGALLGCVTLSSNFVRAEDFHITDIQAGDTSDVFFQINTEGTLYLNIQSVTGAGCAELWWIVWPLGSIDKVGKRCGSASLKIPGLTKFAAASKLRARAVEGHIKILGSSNERVAHNFPRVNFP